MSKSQAIVQKLETSALKAQPKDVELYSRMSPMALYILLGLLLGAVFWADYSTALGIASWVMYVIPVMLALMSSRPVTPLVVASFATVFIVICYYSDVSTTARGVAEVNRFLGVVGIWSMAFVGYAFIRNKIKVRSEEWIQTGLSNLASAMSGEKNISELGEDTLKFVSEYLDIFAAAIFVNSGGVYKKTATYGAPKDSVPESFTTEDGILGQAIKDKRLFLLKDIPDGYLQFGTSFGASRPAYVLVLPAMVEKSVKAVLEFGFDEKPDKNVMTFFERASELMAVAIRSAEYRDQLRDMLEETQRQTEELQAQSEELRVANEELEEQSNALRESQARLEQQQTEVEQTNTQLEEQAQLLETQKTELETTQSELLRYARDIEQASQYKSDFLANMSHELRTPLNSTLILAKLLSENKEGNLTVEQVKFAETIYTSGNDLLELINDILDLSKIEAGYMAVQAENLYVEKIIDTLDKMFEPVAQKKGVKFNVKLNKTAPKSIVSDGKLLEQVLKNLLSNAFKFTEVGSVNLTVSAEGKNKIRFTVKDTGIGIPDEKQKVIFEAFHQADGTTSRNFGGTGLGLSISRELSQLLQGKIDLESREGKGSSFSLVIPLEYEENEEGEETSDQNWSESELENSFIRSNEVLKKEKIGEFDEKSFSKKIKRDALKDDRTKIDNNKRRILIIEDDTSFAKILMDIVRDMGFQCLVSTTAEEGLYICQKFKPHAVVLDIGLPDHSGLTVLDRIKQDEATRHIPVHIISANDYKQTALSLGAIGYTLKPVKRDDLLISLKSLEKDMTQEMRRILIVEDDEVQMESVKKLFAPLGAHVTGVKTAKDCLKKLSEENYDCMVLDLSLPDSDGYSLLETLSEKENYAFPPVIVYTGKDLKPDEEQKLRRYSQSIIIKGAHSPERLLDEVTLFLHHVVSDLPPEQQKMLKQAKNRDSLLEGRRVLIVEDDIRNVYSLRSILEPRGVKIEVANNGQEALDILLSKEVGNDNIDLVLMDVMMPVMDGLTATRKIRQNINYKKLPIIVLTAKAMKDDQEKCLDAGANDYMTKPIDVDKLLSLVRVWMPR